MPILGQQELGGRFDRRELGCCCLAQARLVGGSILLGLESPSRPYWSCDIVVSNGENTHYSRILDNVQDIHADILSWIPARDDETPGRLVLP